MACTTKFQVEIRNLNVLLIVLRKLLFSLKPVREGGFPDCKGEVKGVINDERERPVCFLVDAGRSMSLRPFSKNPEDYCDRAIKRIRQEYSVVEILKTALHHGWDQICSRKSDGSWQIILGI